MVLHGQAGIGKTSVWLAGTDAASSRGYRPLTCRTSESETTFSYAGLADLLDPVVDAALPELPSIQRRALETALLLDESDAPVDERAVAAAFLAALRRLAADGPLVIAVDDVQWLDPASLAVVRFALSRLGDEPLAVLLTARGDPPAWLRRTVPEARLVQVEIAGLSVGARSTNCCASAGRELPTAEAAQALGDVGWKPVLRARAGRRTSEAR